MCRPRVVTNNLDIRSRSTTLRSRCRGRLCRLDLTKKTSFLIESFPSHIAARHAKGIFWHHKELWRSLPTYLPSCRRMVDIQPFKVSYGTPNWTATCMHPLLKTILLTYSVASVVVKNFFQELSEDILMRLEIFLWVLRLKIHTHSLDRFCEFYPSERAQVFWQFSKIKTNSQFETSQKYI